MRLIALGALALVSLSFSGCSMTPERHMSGYESVVAKQKDVVVVPAVVVYTNNKERMRTYESHLKKIIDLEMIPAIQEKGFNVKMLTYKDIHDQKLQRVMKQLDEEYVSKHRILYQRNLWSEKEAFNILENLGSSAVELGEATKSDLLVFVDFASASKEAAPRTHEAIAGFFLGRPLEKRFLEASIIDIGIIDAKTGNLLWMNRHIYKGTGIAKYLETFEKDETAGSNEIKPLIRAVLDSFNKGVKKQ